MSYVVSIHTCGGSMAEAVFSQGSVTVATKEEAKDVEDQLYAIMEKTWRGDDFLVQIFEVGETKTVGAAMAEFFENYVIKDAIESEDE